MEAITVSLTPDQITRILDLLVFGHDEDHPDWLIERELDGALLSYEIDNDPTLDFDGESLYEGDTCQWLMESSNEDGPCAVPCGRPILPDEERALCGWHASAMAIPDDEFERRVEQGETWSR